VNYAKLLEMNYAKLLHAKAAVALRVSLFVVVYTR
jgi:hypothetical protein